VFESLVNRGDGRVIGRNVANLWETIPFKAPRSAESLHTLQPASPEFTQIETIFKTGTPGRSMFPEHTISKSVEKTYKLMNLPPGSFVASGAKHSISRACGFQCTFLLEAR